MGSLITEKRRHYKVDSRFVGDLYTLTYDHDDGADEPVSVCVATTRQL